MHIDILILAIVTVILLWRLWSILGTRNEDEPQRPNPFIPPVALKPQGDEPFTPRVLLPPPVLPPASLAGGLQQIMAADPAFDEKQFLQTARDIFTAVVVAYAASDMDSVSGKLSPALLAHFRQAADNRKAAGQTAESRIAALTEAEIIAARAEAAQIYATVRFVSQQENILRDARGAVIGGEVGKVEEATDIWTFTRDTATPDAPWLLAETHG